MARYPSRSSYPSQPQASLKGLTPPSSKQTLPTFVLRAERWLWLEYRTGLSPTKTATVTRSRTSRGTKAAATCRTTATRRTERVTILSTRPRSRHRTCSRGPAMVLRPQSRTSSARARRETPRPGGSENGACREHDRSRPWCPSPCRWTTPPRLSRLLTPQAVRLQLYHRLCSHPPQWQNALPPYTLELLPAPTSSPGRGLLIRPDAQPSCATALLHDLYYSSFITLVDRVYHNG